MTASIEAPGPAGQVGATTPERRNMTPCLPTSKRRGIHLVLALIAGLFCGTFPGTQVLAQDGGPDYFTVTGLTAGDTLNIRSGPGTGNRVIAVAPNGAVFRNLGCREGWCHVETSDGRVNGWAANRYLSESGTPTHHTATSAPELHIRNTGEYEVRFSSGCTALFNPVGRRINAGSSCSRSQLTQAQDAVERYRREQGIGASTSTEGGGGQRDVNMSGTGSIYGGGTAQGRIMGHQEGRYAIIVNALKDGFSCTAKLDHAPGSVRSEAVNLHCTNGASGYGTLVQSRSGQKYVLTFSLSNGEGGFVTF